MYLSIKGGTKRQRALVEDVAVWSAYKLMGRLAHNIDVDIILKKQDDADGWCEWMDKNICPREFEIRIRKTLADSEIILTVVHEMVHVKQMARGELKEVYRGGHRQVWKGKNVDKNYKDQPWEKEAYNLQTQLAKEYILQKGMKYVRI